MQLIKRTDCNTQICTGRLNFFLLTFIDKKSKALENILNFNVQQKLVDLKQEI